MKTKLKIGDNVEFDNKLVHGTATITNIVEKDIYEKINGERIRYILNLNGTTHICSPSEIIAK